jgi:transposase
MESTIDYNKIIAEKDAKIIQLEALVKYYEELFRQSKIRQFTPSSEKKGCFQYTVFADDVCEPVEDKTEPEPENIVYIRKKKKTGKRKEDLSRLPVETVDYELAAGDRVCPECGGDMHVMGHDSRHELKIIPAQAKVIEHRRSVYSCRNCEKNNDHVPIIKADIPAPLIKNSIASPSAVAHLMYQKYVMYAPLYRQEKDWERQGMVLSRQTMANWIIYCAEEKLKPLYMKLRDLLLFNEVLHADESGLQVLHEPGKTAMSKSYMWL